MLILAGVSISILTGENGVLSQAQESKEKTDKVHIEELHNLTSASAAMNLNGYTDTKTKLYIPAGFEISQVEEERNIDNGLIMIDKNGNEYVWVEVPKKVTENATTDEQISQALQAYAGGTMKSDGTSIINGSNYREGSSSQNLSTVCKDEWYAWDEDNLKFIIESSATESEKLLKNGCGLSFEEYNQEYSKMLRCIKENGGFLISRYEIGDEKATSSSQIVLRNDNDITGKPVSKPNQVPYNYVTCSQAQILASTMSPNSNCSSNLLFGIQWDLVCKFLEEKGKLTYSQIAENSTSIGNYKYGSITLNRGFYCPYYTSNPELEKWVPYNSPDGYYLDFNKKTSQSSSYNVLLTTGASEETNTLGIYDLGGNVWEYTLELSIEFTDKPSVCRGANANSPSNYPIARRGRSSVNKFGSDIGFRSTIYW